MRLARFILRCLFITLISLPLSAETYDLIIRNASLIDGTGSPARAGDLAIRAGRIAAIGQLTAGSTAPIEINAAGQSVAPGFIDVHTHCEDVNDLPTAENFLRMGVTTIVTGNCGGSKLEVGAFLAQIEQTGISLNVATLIGHNTVRFQVMGGSFMRPPTPAELEKMPSSNKQ
jgi:N-acyl-D-amino-acid deacylase